MITGRNNCFGFALCWLISCIGCTFVASDALASSVLPLTSVSDFYEDNSSYDGERIRVRGYLFNDTASAWFLHRSMEEGSTPDAPFILINRSALTYLPDYTIDDPTIECADNYVELVGVAGQFPDNVLVGIIEIESITVFKDETFTGRGVLCFDASSK